MSLQVRIDPGSGFCFGVVYAVQMAESFLEASSYLYCLGDIVHNEAEVQRLIDKGLRIIDHDKLNHLRDEAVLIRAHGEPPSTYRTALANNLTLIDASCPVVLKLQNRIKSSYDRGNSIFIFGKATHAEVLGLVGQTQHNAVVFESLEELLKHPLPQHITIYSQTTQSAEKFYQLRQSLVKMGFSIDAHDTICRQVSNRDQSLHHFATQHDQVVFVAGSKSSNGRTLYEVCKSANTNSHFVSEPQAIQVEWFGANQTVGICGATSTPMWLMQKVRDVLISL
ncbi:4-hydroxy-3-methylbut-2-enyl diphosphate reductase [Hymenobacter gummosus]|uniref:4-hydroxy-3-methylbut-2-enyl diphosphate reductase n=1 Tax=Hymenobacter gummosus TaxID=1776032 RepID=A0A431U928_9BACT|nr:4-hydroxy-3-methylbut-2-enyl diphosphate reductase [Hymenobacter gummosus]